MPAIVLKSGNALDASIEPFDYVEYRKRVVSDGGTIVSASAIKSAILFITQGTGKLSAGNVFSATSPNWGVKFSNGLPVKLYSLFNSKGDLLLDVQSGSLVAYEAGLYSYPVVRFGGSAGGGILNNGYSSVGTFDATSDVAVGVVTKNTSPLGTAGYRFTCYPKDSYQTAGTNKLLGFGDTGTGLRLLTVGNGFTTNQQIVTSESLLAWSKAVVYRDNASVSIIDNQVTTREWAATVAADRTALTLDIARSVLDNTTEMKYSATMKADFAEAWLLVGAGKLGAEALSARLSAKYA